MAELKMALKAEVVAGFDKNRVGTAYFRDLIKNDQMAYAELHLQSFVRMPGTVVTVEVQQCPKCNELSSKANNEGFCPCGHDWAEWANKHFSESIDEQS